MIDNKDVKKIIAAMKGIFVTKKDLKVFATKKDLAVFPTAEMVQESFLATDKNVAEGFKKVDDRLDGFIAKHDEEITSLKTRTKITEEALGID